MGEADKGKDYGFWTDGLLISHFRESEDWGKAKSRGFDTIDVSVGQLGLQNSRQDSSCYYKLT